MSTPGRPVVLTTIALAIIGGAAAGLLTAAFIWMVEHGVHLVWVTVPGRLDVEPFGSWWHWAIPIVGGLLVGLGQRFIGDLPLPIAEVLTRFRRGEGVDPKVVPGAIVLATVALVAGGALGFEAALATVVGGLATGVGRLIGPRSGGALMLPGTAPGSELPPQLRSMAGWLAALSALFAYLWVPFGEIDLGFRLDAVDGLPKARDAVIIVAFAGLVAIPAAWGVHLVVRAEHAGLVRRNPVALGVAGGVVLAALGNVHELVFFSGQQGFRSLGELGSGELAYVAVAKAAALVVMMLAGWRGGPIFPMYLAVAALAVLACRPLDVPVDLAVVAGVTVVSVIFLRGRIVMAVILTIYAVPVSYAGVMLVVACAAAIALVVGGEMRWLPSKADPMRADAPTAA